MKILFAVLLGLFPITAFAQTWYCYFLSGCTGSDGNVTCDDSSGSPSCTCLDMYGQTAQLSYSGLLTINSDCKQPVSGTSSATSTGTSTSISTGTSATVAMETSHPVVAAVEAKGGTSVGGQTSSLADVNELNALGANQAATVGALFCAESANASLSSGQDSAELMANCKQNFSAANLMKPTGGFSPVETTVNNPNAQKVLNGFTENFGVTSEDYLKHMLGGSGGASRLTDLVGEKIPADKLAALMEAADKIGPAPPSAEANRFAVDLTKGKNTNTPPQLRDLLRKRLTTSTAEIEERAPASEKAEKYESLTPATDVFFAAQEESSLTLFDVVHLRYAEIRKRWRR